MQIKKHIQNARSIRFWQDVILSLLWIGIIGSLLFLIGIELETVFYFLPEIKSQNSYSHLWIIQCLCILLVNPVFQSRIRSN